MLNGLQIKVSSKHGKITAVFSGKDAEVLKLIEAERGRPQVRAPGPRVDAGGSSRIEERK